jgi:uncharacterized OsmC-like protein
MTTIQVTHLIKSRYRVAVGGHVLTVDQPAAAGGDDQGPTPVQLFTASLAACVAHYAASYLVRHGLSTEGLVVEGDFTMADERPARVISMSVRITPPPGLPSSRKAGLLAVASRCTLHNTLRQPTTVNIALAGQPSTTAVGYIATPSATAGRPPRSTTVGVGSVSSSSPRTASTSEPPREAQ